MKRTAAREQAFVLIFEKIFHPDLSVEEIEQIAAENEVFTVDEFTEQLFETTVENVESIDRDIETYLKGWKLNRISKVALAILRIAAAEIEYFEDVPSSVSVNEAVELAKKYGADKDPSFINGVLGSYLKDRDVK